MSTLNRHAAALTAATRITKDEMPSRAESPVSERFGHRSLSWRQLAGLVDRADADALRALVDDHVSLPRVSADHLAEAVQTWAASHGATHYAHWFHPLTGIPADKGDAILGFAYDAGEDPRPIEDFTGSKLLQGEPDASSFPSGGLRETGAARGYTAWDPTSPIFVRADGSTRTLCIPCAYVSWTGHALDHKTPLLRARAAVEAAALRVLDALDARSGARSVQATLGPEQEYFVVDRAFLASRPDLLMTGRTLVGSPPPRGQQLEDHYFAPIPARVQAFITDVEEELWALGVPVKTRHNEVAPAQFETAPVFEEVNIAIDHNVLTMDVLRRIADRHGLVCLLHEKPFAGINGSGKHNNWSLATDTGINLLDPGQDPLNDTRFLTFLGASLLGLYRHADALRATIASAGNDHRLGANEAPPPILSAYVDFCVQSCCKPINYCLALEEHGEEKVHAHIGREPSGVGFNELKLNAEGKPHNPMINAGAIMCCSLVRPQLDIADRFDFVMDRWRALAGGTKAGFSNPTYLSERATADRNFALGYHMQERKAFPKGTNLVETLEFYFQCCSIEQTCESMSVVAATLANGGVCPLTGEQVLNPHTVQSCLSLMSSCGMYDFSGEFAFTIGLPAKSGVAGAVMVVVPNVLGVVIWSPRLDRVGNSVRGIAFCRGLVERFNFHAFDILTGLSEKTDPRRNRTQQASDELVALIWAASKGDLWAVQQSSERGVNLEAADYDGRTPLHLAASEGHENVVRYLLGRGVNPRPIDRWGNTPLDDAKRGNHATVVVALGGGPEPTGKRAKTSGATA